MTVCSLLPARELTDSVCETRESCSQSLGLNRLRFRNRKVTVGRMILPSKLRGRRAGAAPIRIETHGAVSNARRLQADAEQSDTPVADGAFTGVRTEVVSPDGRPGSHETVT